MTAITFPLSVDDFLRDLRPNDVRFDLSESLQFNQTRGQEILRADAAPRIWVGTVTFAPTDHITAAARDALLDLLREADGTFYVTNSARPFPARDPGALILGPSVVRIDSLDADAKRLTLKGLPAAYELVRGDMLSFDYDTGRRALHRVVSASVVAGPTGTTPVFEVRPHVRPGAAVDAVVTLVRPSCLAVVVPDSVSAGAYALANAGSASLQFMQSLKRANT